MRPRREGHVNVTVYLTPEQKDWLEQRARETDRSVSGVVRYTIESARKAGTR